jgi:putative ABC transport system permease protein
VLGASITGILLLLAIIIASSVAWYVVHLLLQDFAYPDNISWWIFASAGLLSMMIALLVIGFQKVRSAIANPANSLRTE